MLTVHLLFAARNFQAHEAVLDALRRKFKGAQVVEASSVDEVLLKGHLPGRELMVLIQPDMTETELALKTGQDHGMARWPLVCLSGDIHSSGLDVIAPEDWHGPLLAQVFRAALQRHDLVRENTRLRGDLLTMARRISHDLRTPLSGIFTTSELLKEILSEQSAEDAALTSPLFDSSQAVLKLIERVSQVTRASVEDRRNEPVDMEQVAWAARQGAERAAMENNIEINEPADWPVVEGVPPWLEVIFGELLYNAVRHTGKGRKVEMQWRELPAEFEFSVLDDGPGVPPEKQGGLFYPFERLHVSHSARGLGLSIARRLVELQGGRCGYELRPEGGSRFFFTLPKADSVQPG
jgi:K+-sensing histidine kinase KdpD